MEDTRDDLQATPAKASPVKITVPAEISGQSSDSPDSEPEKPLAFWERVWFVLLLLFVFAGPFGLPFLWKSREFPLWLKIVLTVLVLAILAYALYMLWWISAKFMGALREAGYVGE